MKLIETKTYKVEIKGDVERAHLRSMAEKLEKIARLLDGKEVFYTSIDDCTYKMEIKEIEDMVEFLRALANEDVEVC
jgi:hypothetical protein